MTRWQMSAFDGLPVAERDQMLYEFFWAASDTGGHLPPVRSLARLFVRRRNLQVFTSAAGSAPAGILAIDHKVLVRGRLLRWWPARNRTRS
jgi:hypothetical protein